MTKVEMVNVHVVRLSASCLASACRIVKSVQLIETLLLDAQNKVAVVVESIRFAYSKSTASRLVTEANPSIGN